MLSWLSKLWTRDGSKVGGKPRVEMKKMSGSGTITYGVKCPRALQHGGGSKEMNLTDFRLLRAIGHGSAATVFEAIHIRSQTQCVLKVCLKARLRYEEEKRFLREIHIHSSLDCDKHVVPFYASFQDAHAFYIVLEYCPKGDLLSYVRRKYEGGVMPLDAFRERVLVPLLKGLAYLHELSVIHRDIKTENLVLDGSGKVRICDLGFSISLAMERPKSVIGTMEYMPPEVLMEKTDLFSEKIDIWAVGILTYECLCGVTPFYMTTERALVAAILDGKYYIPSHLTGETVYFIKCCLHPSPQRRWSAKELLEHVLVRGGKIGGGGSGGHSGHGGQVANSKRGGGERSRSYSSFV